MSATLANYYTATVRITLPTTPLPGDHTTDVAIIIGGITGVSAALHLAERGFHVALLEAGDTIGRGASEHHAPETLPNLQPPPLAPPHPTSL